MAAWPSTLPQSPLAKSLSETTPNDLIRTKMDVGPDKIRRRSTAGIRRFGMSIFMTKAQVQILDDFIQSTLNGGTDTFTWINHRTDAAATLRFISLPAYRTLGNGDYYSAGLSLEELP